MGEIVDHQQITFCPLSEDVNTQNFNCGNVDLNGFLKDDALEYQKNHLAFTTCLYHNETLIAYYSIMSDSLKLSTREKEKMFRVNKHLRSYPAIKIARLACLESCKKQKLGTLMVNLVKGHAVELNGQGVAVRFITVDAYPEVVRFYERCGFIENKSDLDSSKKRKTVSMRYDIYG